MKNVLCLFSLMILAVTLTGCGGVTVPAPDVMKADLAGYTLPVMPDDNHAVVYVVRPSSGAPAVSFDVYIDGQEKETHMIGYNDTKEYIYATLNPGKHTLYSKAENWVEMKIDAAPHQLYFFEQVPKIGILFARNELIKLDDLEGKYHVKQLELGTFTKK